MIVEFRNIDTLNGSVFGSSTFLPLSGSYLVTVVLVIFVRKFNK